MAKTRKQRGRNLADAIVQACADGVGVDADVAAASDCTIEHVRKGIKALADKGLIHVVDVKKIGPRRIRIFFESGPGDSYKTETVRGGVVPGRPCSVWAFAAEVGGS